MGFSSPLEANGTVLFRQNLFMASCLCARKVISHKAKKPKTSKGKADSLLKIVVHSAKCVTKHIATNTIKVSDMSESTFTFRVDEDLKAAFTAAAKDNDRTAAQILRETMREYIAAEAPPTPEYVEW